jgi:hypothetical protein
VACPQCDSQRWPQPGRGELEQKCIHGGSYPEVAAQVHGRVKSPLHRSSSVIPHASSKHHPSVITSQHQRPEMVKPFRTVSDRNKLLHLLLSQRKCIRIICSSLDYLLILIKCRHPDRDLLGWLLQSDWSHRDQRRLQRKACLPLEPGQRFSALLNQLIHRSRPAQHLNQAQQPQPR